MAGLNSQPAALPHNITYRRGIRCLIIQVTEGVKGMDLRQESKHELVAAIRERNFGASRCEKGKILDEFIASTRYHRKWGIRLLRGGPPKSRKGRGGRPRVYSAVVVGALRQEAEESGWVCGERVAPLLGEV